MARVQRPSADEERGQLKLALESALEHRYREWRVSDAGNKVFPLFERFALEMLHRERHFGFRLIAERVRWEVMQNWSKEDADGFRVNDHLTPYIARELVRKYPDMSKYVEMRKIKVF